MNIDGEKRISICYEDNYGRVSIENYRLNEIVKYIEDVLISILSPS